MTSSLKRIREIFEERWTKDGAGVRLNRVFGYSEMPNLDPFLLLDFFNSRDPKDYRNGFPWHPHRGIETVTYLIHGKIAHGDSLGNSGIIESGDCQWMTAGSGIMHQEMPQATIHMLGFQLWINLPKANKMTQPTYRDLKRAQLPIVEKSFGQVRVVSGNYDGVNGSVQADYVKPIFLDIRMDSDADFELMVSEGDTLITLLISGAGIFEENGCIQNRVGEAILFERENEILKIKAGPQGLRFILLSGKPLCEPIAWGGPVVMNTKEELDLAFEQIQNGTFV